MSDLEFTISGIIPATRKEQFLAAILAAMEEQPVPPEPRDPSVTELDVTLTAPTTITMKFQCGGGQGADAIASIDAGAEDATVTKTVEAVDQDDVITITCTYLRAGKYTVKIKHASVEVTAIRNGEGVPFASGNNASLTKVWLGDSVIELGQYCLAGAADLADIDFNSVVTIGDFACNSCISLAKCMIPDTVTTLRAHSFGYCSNLTQATVSANVAVFPFAFSTCDKLSSLTVKAASPPRTSATVIGSLPQNITIYVPAESVDAYKAANGWKEKSACIQAITS